MLRTTLLLLPLSLLLACAPQMPPAAAANGAAPVGNYSVSIAESDLPASTPARYRDVVVGNWDFAFHPGNHVVVSFRGDEVVQTAFQMEGNQILFPAEDSGSYACRTPAVYTWQESGGQLTFTRVQDSCTGRILALTTRPLVRRP